MHTKDVAQVEDSVIGIVEERGAGFYRMALYGTLPATLPWLAFEGATKRTKPTLKVGDAVYMRIVTAPRDIEPECSCIAVHGNNRKGWETGEATFGVLEGGMAFRCTQAQVSWLRDRSDKKGSQVLYDTLSKEGIKFEVVIGANGVVWVKGASARFTICVSNIIQNSFVLESNEIKSMVKKVLEISKDRPDKDEDDDDDDDEDDKEVGDE
jgi:exosome complex component RRP40